MGLFDAFRRKPLHPSGRAGTTAKSVKLNDFEAEVEACGLKDDWGQKRLGELFGVFDIDGNGEIDVAEFTKTAVQLERLLAALKSKGPPKTAEALCASHNQLMTSLGYKVEGVPEVKFTPTFFGDAAKAVPFKNRHGKIVSWGYTTDFTPFEKTIWPLFKEMVEGTMALEMRSGPRPDRKDKALAIKVANEIGLSFWTTVLATVHVPGWRALWMLMVLHLILVSYPTCAELYLNALNGGPACKCEISFIRTVMRGLGFKRNIDGLFNQEKKCTYFTWSKERPGFYERRATEAEPFCVHLTVHHDPDDIDVEGICTNLNPESVHATAPNLRRIAVVSAPVTDDRGERADERLNAALGKALKMMQERVKEKGFRDND
tara:strand:+ start:225 stop:1349 length:1125 start_codon:yes stop_codon:yes gene_type:complete